MIRHQWNFTILSNKYSISETSFPGGQKIQLFPVNNRAKSDHSNKKLMKDVLRPNFFLDVIQYDTNANILTLDTNTGELYNLWIMISQLTSNVIIYISSYWYTNTYVTHRDINSISCHTWSSRKP